MKFTKKNTFQPYFNNKNNQKVGIARVAKSISETLQENMPERGCLQQYTGVSPGCCFPL
jgi:hypothetical protein